MSELFSLKGKTALVVGVANADSIAWGVAHALRRAGAELAITYLNAKAEPHVRPLAESLGASIISPLDVTDAAQMQQLFADIRQKWGRLDTVVHSIAFARREDLHGRVLDSDASGFGLSMDISVHSFVRLVRLAEPLMTREGCCLAMSFYGAERVVPSYNIMGPVKAALEATCRELASELGPAGIRVNVLSPGAMPTRAAGGIAGFDQLLEDAKARAPLRRLATIEDVGAMAAFLASDAGRNITGNSIHIDAGYHIMA